MSALAILSAFAVCWLTLAWLLRRRDVLPMDHPNARSLHETPTPRVGGLGVVAGVGVASLWLADTALLPVIFSAFALAAVSLLDDFRSLSVWVRFLAHFGVALSCVVALGFTDWTFFVVALVAVWMTNLYNFMDGADGLAGGMATIGFSALALAAWLGGATGFPAFCAAIAAAALAFLRFNFPPARIFMGDAGSIPLGFLSAALGIQGALQGVWPVWYPLAVFSPFIVDASVTLSKRIMRREQIWRPHKEHYYQRLIRMGWGHRETVLAEYALMLVISIAATIALDWTTMWQGGFLFACALCYAALAFTIDSKWRSHLARESRS